MDNNNIRKKTDIIYPDGYLYHRIKSYAKRDGTCTTYLKCILKNSCPGRGKLVNINKKEIFEQIKKHNHKADKDKRKNIIFKEKLKEFARSETLLPSTSARDIYDFCAYKDPTGAETVNFQAIDRSIRRWKQKDFLKLDITLENMENVLNDKKLKNFLRFYVKKNKHRLRVFEYIENEIIAIFFYDKKLCQSLKTFEEIYVDGTFESTPQLNNIKIYQLLTFMTEHKTKAVPFLWVLATSKSQQLYSAILNFMKLKIIPNLEPDIIHVDYETALQNALFFHFPRSKIRGCYFHFVQSIRKNAKKLKIFKGFKNLLPETQMEILFYLRLLYNIPLLPNFLLQTGFHLIKRKIEQSNVRNKFDKLLLYIERYWINIVDPRTVSVFNEKTRTNNVIERYHRILKEKFGSHPNLFNFISKL
ncbi:uncharacterized protein [Prorops nasuta]|uniref:uncharacterized protein n=1 Tax=Prorops nasuta TaxID=863751 RepID=UPI0034CDCCCD